MDRIRIMQRIVDKKMKQREGAEELKLTERQIRRLLKKFKKDGAQGLVPLYKGSKKKFKEAQQEEILGLIDRYYKDFGPTLASEKLEENHSIKVSRETIRHWMIKAEFWKPKQEKKRRIHQSRQRRPRFGELVQIDGSHHDWFEGRGEKCSLIVMIDDATSQIIHMRFETSETTLGYMRCVESHVRKYGKPIAYYSDRHSIFKTSRKEWVDGKQEDTQLHRALRELNIGLICANSPQAKGRVERCNSTLQDRLVKEMRLRGISSMEEGNEYLEEYIKKHNKKFGVKATHPEDAHRPCGYAKEELDYILSVRAERKVSKNLEVSFEGKIYQIQEVGKGRRLQQATVTVYETNHGETKIAYEQKALKYKILTPQKASEPVDCKEINGVVDEMIRKNLGLFVCPQGPQPLAQLST